MSAFERLLDGLFPHAVEGGALERRGAAALASLLSSGSYGGARFVRSARREGGGELLFVEAFVPLGQRTPVADVRPVEPLAVLYVADDQVPLVYPLRDDFPDVPHFNVAHDGEPRSLCLFDMPADEALRVATPFVLLERTRWWLRETAHGRLHGDDQPLDPLFAGSRHSVVLPPDGLREGGVLVGHRRSDDDRFPIMLERTGRPRSDLPTFACLNIVTAPLAHGRIRALPRSVSALVGIYRELGVDLIAPLRATVRSWVQDGGLSHLLGHRLLMFVTTPIERTTGRVDAVVSKGFFLDVTAGDLAEALGVARRDPDGRFGVLLGASPIDEEALTGMATEAVDVRRGFERELARSASGLSDAEPFPEVTLIGAGALGSQVASNAARGGSGRWSIVDPDHLMPHNLARHALTAEHVGLPKASAMAELIVDLLGIGAAKGFVADVRELGDDAEKILSADLVIDASASVPCSRWLACVSHHAAPTTSIFLNPSGVDLVVMREAADRAIRLDHLEMIYYWLLATQPALEGHLRSGGTILPSGGCRNPSVQLSQAVVGAHAAHATRELFERRPGGDAEIVLWLAGDDGERRVAVPGERFVEVELGGWTIAVREPVLTGARRARSAAGPLETGGILVGGWDRQLRKAWIVAHLDPPPDSEHAPTGFVRGLVGVHRTLEHIEGATAVNLTYVGEWHTHPPLHTSAPSEDDRLLMRWIGDAVAFSDVPPLMMIAGDDGLRLMLGTVSRHALLPEVQAEQIGEAD